MPSAADSLAPHLCRRAGGAGDHPRQRIHRRAAGASDGQADGRLARARGRDQRRGDLVFGSSRASGSAFRTRDAEGRARGAGRFDLRMALGRYRVRDRPARTRQRRGADHRLWSWRKRRRRHAAGDRAARLCRSSWRRPASWTSPPMSTFEASRARRPKAWAPHVHGPIDQGDFLLRLGIEARADALKAAALPEKKAEIEAAVARLTQGGRTGMGACSR